MKIKNSRLTLGASTLVEVIIFMILSGIVFISVMDGLELQKYFCNKMSQRINDRIEQFSGYLRVADMIKSTDSLCVSDRGEVALFRQDAIYACLFKLDSVLIIRKDTLIDTLLHNVCYVRVVPELAYDGKVDSLIVGLKAEQDSCFRFSFAPRPMEDSLFTLLTKQELDYRYEENELDI